MSKKNFRNMIIISSVLLLSLVLAACGGKEEVPITVPAGALAVASLSETEAKEEE